MKKETFMKATAISLILVASSLIITSSLYSISCPKRNTEPQIEKPRRPQDIKSRVYTLEEKSRPLNGQIKQNNPKPPTILRVKDPREITIKPKKLEEKCKQ